MSNLIKTKEEIAIMAEGGHILANILQQMMQASVAGVSTKDIENLAEKLCLEYNVIPATKGYYGFPSSFCSCVNDVVVHGIPNDKEILKNGDIFTLDMVIIHKGLMVDAARTVAIGDITPEAQEFIDTVKQARDKAIKVIKPGIHVGDVSAMMEYTVKAKGYNPVKEMTGHGIGKEMHEDPYIPCYGFPGTGPMIKEGMTLAIEAIISMGNGKISISKEDGWTTTTKDHALAAVWEHTVLVTHHGSRILTQ